MMPGVVDPGKRTVLFVLLIMMSSSVRAEDRLINTSKLEMFVDKLPDMPRVQGFDIVDGVPKPKSLDIGMYETRWVSKKAHSFTSSSSLHLSLSATLLGVRLYPS
ncbi:hypothetical protein EUGRSUZ_L03602 [Eucalyptus grandis]|uniref:Uncharacterized protein n=1 Tax=Eucalyptus grandis TaxID=71139 RepID=A0AAD9T7T7_EUCGR|nr:hypothetical protein EUGRSUZ_L03602 [Eucalyptus grandis]